MKTSYPFYKQILISDEIILHKIYQYFLKIEWSNDVYQMYGKTIMPKRKTFMYGKNYTYSGNTKISVPFDKQIHYLSQLIEKQLKLPKNYFNACLLNFYPDGEAGLFYHKDDEEEMNKNAPIVSFSIGATRKFYLKHDKTKEVVKLEHKSGGILVMNPETQKDWIHSIPKDKNIRSGRISLTFRRF